MRRALPLLAAVLPLSALAARAGAEPTPGAAPRVELPIREVTLSDGARRYAVSVRVGSTTLEAGLDSGSTGLRILPGALAEGDAAPTARASVYGYNAGAELRGVVGRATVGFGALSGPAEVELVRSVGCRAAKPDCTAGRIPLKDYGIQGDGLPGEGFKAIMGVNTGAADAANPLVAAGARRWLIELPEPGRAGPGRLVLNPTAEETAGYVEAPFDPTVRDTRGGARDSVPACLPREAGGRAICGPALMDTGAPGLLVRSPDGEAAWPNGTPARLSLLRDGRVVAERRFTVGRRDQSSRLEIVRAPDLPGPRLSIGLLPYFAWSVLYDPARGAIAVKPRPEFGADD